MGCNLAPGVHDRELAALLRPSLRVRVGVSGENLPHGVGGRVPLAQERQRLGAVADIDDGLGGDHADARLAPDDTVPHGEDA